MKLIGNSVRLLIGLGAGILEALHVTFANRRVRHAHVNMLGARRLAAESSGARRLPAA